MHIPILLETPHVLIVNKPPGVPFHNSIDGLAPGIVTLVREQRGELPLFPVHRLDTITSGALLMAKTPEGAQEAITAFRERAVSKYYVGISRRKPAKKQGSVVGDMAKTRRGSWMLLRSRENPALTRFVSVSLPDGEGRSFLLHPTTGKTHQLRVAMKSIGSPIAGDARYAAANEAATEDRAYLHCAALRLVIHGEPVQVICKPQDGAGFLSQGFSDVFDSWFPKGIENDNGDWFPESKLLRSSLIYSQNEG